MNQNKVGYSDSPCPSFQCLLHVQPVASPCLACSSKQRYAAGCNMTQDLETERNYNNKNVSVLCLSGNMQSFCIHVLGAVNKMVIQKHLACFVRDLLVAIHRGEVFSRERHILNN